jgi:hypothetical protein
MMGMTFTEQRLRNVFGGCLGLALGAAVLGAVAVAYWLAS